jgi:tetratricopeptide (TPR) repeat protein
MSAGAVVSGEPFVETLLSAKTLADAAQQVRRSSRPPAVVSMLLLDEAGKLQSDRPAAAAAAVLLASVLLETVSAQPFPGDDRFSAATNAVLREASLAGGWGPALSILRRNRGHLDEGLMLPVIAWHGGLAQAGFPPTTNGAALVITLGVVLGGAAQAYAHLAWARACEATSLRRAVWHMKRARRIAEASNADEAARYAAVALQSLYSRRGLVEPVEAPLPPVGDRPLDVPANESMAANLRDAGRNAEALEILDRTVPVAVRAGLTAQLVRLLNLRGLVHDDLAEYVQADDDFRESARLAGQVGDHQRRHEALTNAAASFLKRGQPIRAVPAFRSLLQDADASGQLPRQIAARNNLALAYSDAGDPAMARDLYQEALSLLGDSPSTDSYWTTVSGLARQYSVLGDDAACREIGARLWRQWSDERSDQALVAYLTSVASDLSDATVFDTAERVLVTWTQRGDLVLAGSLCLRLATEDRRLGRPDRALDRLDGFLAAFSSERSTVKICIEVELRAAEIEATTPGRHAHALNRLRASVARIEQRLAAADTAYDRDWILDTARPVYERLIDLLVGPPQPTTAPMYEAWAEALWLSEASRPATLTSLAGPAPSPAGGQARVVGLADVVRAIDPAGGRRVAVVCFVETGTRIGAFVVATATGPAIFWRALEVTAEAVTEAGRELSVAFNGNTSAFPPRRPLAATNLAAVRLPTVDDVLARLGGALVGLPAADVVCLVPSRSLQDLPLAAIRQPNGRRLIEDVSVVTQPSLSALVATTAQPPPRATRPRVFVAGVAAAEDAHPEFFEEDVRLFASSDIAGSVTGLQATKAAAVAGMQASEVTHLSCHGFVDARDPLGSGLLLSDGVHRPSRRRQSVPLLDRQAFELTVRELAKESLRTELVTLRACSTARSAAVSAKEEISTLLRVLQAAGCRTVVSALWNVDQESSLSLFGTFYRAYLDGGLPACDAMAYAQRAFIGWAGPAAHLYHWGAYIVSGDWRIRR